MLQAARGIPRSVRKRNTPWHPTTSGFEPLLTEFCSNRLGEGSDQRNSVSEEAVFADIISLPRCLPAYNAQVFLVIFFFSSSDIFIALRCVVNS